MIDKHWNEMLQVLTEDENGRIRKTDMKSLERSDVIEFMTNLNFFEQRMEEKMAQLNKIQHAKG